MLVPVLEGVAGLVLAVLTLRDVFDTVVVPQRTQGPLKISRRLTLALLPLHRHLRQRPIAVYFAPGVLVGSFVAWMLLLVAAFGLMVHALKDSFAPALRGFGHALYVAGGSMATTGFGTTEPHGPAAVVTVAAGLCGLAVMTLAITYLIEVQSNIAVRDKGVLQMSTTAGHPPAAAVVLERYGRLGCREELADLLRESRGWCASVLQSHVSHPTLIYFRSAGTGSGWPAALGVVVDLALIAEMLLDEPGTYGPAVLAREGADRLTRDVTELLSLDVPPCATSMDEVERVVARLDAAGYRLRADRDLDAFVERRARHVAGIQALARHLGTTEAVLLPAHSEAGDEP